MASVPFYEDFLSTSTPIQQHNDSRLSGSCKRFYASPEKEIDLLSPIKSSSRFNLYEYLSHSSETSHFQILNIRNRVLTGVNRKLRFVEISKLVDASDDNDSGIESERNLSTSDDQSLLNGEISYFTDENSNVINSCDSNNNSYHRSFSYAFPQKFNNELNTNSKDKLDSLDNGNKNATNRNDGKSQNVTNLDILRELNIRNCYAVLSLILSNLDDEDLRKASYVSKDWHAIVFNDKEAYIRRKAHIKEKRDIANGPKKENRFHPKCNTVERSHKSAFNSVINSPSEVSQQPLCFIQTVGRFDSFIQEAQNLQNEEKLIKCPKCFYPSKVQSGNVYCCTRHLCQHVFCQKCLGPHLDNHSCSVPKLNATHPQIKIGSKQSKKNLQRL